MFHMKITNMEEHIEEEHFAGIGNEYFVLERIYLGYMHIFHGCSSRIEKLMF